MTTDLIRVLLIEDDPDDVYLLKESFAEAKSVKIKVAIADYLSTGLEYIAVHEVDVVLLDLNLPDSHGLETLNTMLNEFPKIPVVVLSGLADDFTTLEAVRRGAQDYLIKGEISSPMLVRVLRYAMERKNTEEVLQQERDFAVQVLNTMGQGLTVTNAEGKFEFTNPSYRDMIGYTPEELVGTFPRDYTIPDDLDIQDKVWGSPIQRKPSIHEIRLRRADGVIIPASIASVPRISTGEFIGMISVVTDLSERKQAEEALRRHDAILETVSFAAEQFLKTQDWQRHIPHVLELLGMAVQSSRVCLFKNYLSPEGAPLTNLQSEWVAPGITSQLKNQSWQNYLFKANEGIFRHCMTSLSRGKLISGKIDSFPDEEQRILAAQNIQSLLVLPIFVGSEWWGFIELDDCMHQREWYVAEIDALKTATSTLGAAIQRSQVETALRDSEAKYRRLVENVKDIIYAGNLTTSLLASPLTFVSEQVATILGYTPDEFLRDPLIWFNNIHPADAKQIGEETQKAITEKKPCRRVYRFQSKISGEYRWLEDDFLPQVDEKGQVVGYFGVARDITDRKQAEEEIHRQLNRLAALRTIDQAITSSTDMELTLNIILAQINAQLGIDAANVLLFDHEKNGFENCVRYGFRTSALDTFSLQLDNSYAGLAIQSRQIVHIPNLQHGTTDCLRLPAFSQEGFASYFGVPLIVKGGVKGVLEIFQRSALNPNKEWFDFLETLAGQAAIAIDNCQLFNGLQRSNLDLTLAYDATIEGWSHALDLRDKETEGHTQRVTEMTLRMAQAMGVSETELVHVRRGALLHDIGKMGIPDHILLKPGPLTEEEWILMRKHPVYAYEMLSPIDYLEHALDIPYCHHEKWDGTGYPQGLTGEQIPLSARIFTLVDVWDALTSDRPYRSNWSREESLVYIQEQAGKYFDPKLVETFLRLISQK